MPTWRLLVICGQAMPVFRLCVTNRVSAVSSSMDEQSEGDTVTSALGESLTSDHGSIERLEQGQETSFDTLFYRHYDRIYGLVFRLTGERAEAEDLAQEAFIRLHAALGAGRFRDTTPNISAWLYRVALNLGYNALRSRRRMWQRNVHLLPVEQGDPSVESDVARREERRLVREVLAELPERQAQLLILRQMGFSYAECAMVCDVAPGSVGTLLARAAESFRRVYVAKAGSPERTDSRGEER